MTSQKKKFQKKKNREKEVRKKILADREAMRAPAREDRKVLRKLKRISKLKQEMGEYNQWSDEVLMTLNDSALSRLEANAKTLKNLENEYEQEVYHKMDEQNLTTVDQKVGPPRQKKDVAVVEVIKAPVDLAQVEVIKAPDAVPDINESES